MSNQLVETIVSKNDRIRNRSITSLLLNKNRNNLLELAEGLETFRVTSNNLYYKVRASLFLFVIYRYYLQENKEIPSSGIIPFEGIKFAFQRDFEKSIDIYLKEFRGNGIYNGSVFSALAYSYYNLSFKYLLDQVKLSISKCKENYHLFNIKELSDYPYSVPLELTSPHHETDLYPVGLDRAPVRLDPSHSGWSDIFFLAMDYPESARVVNLSVNLRIYGSNGPILPPCECYCRYIKEPIIRLTSVDLKTSKDISTSRELFNYGNDYLSLLKAGVVASGVVPPSFEGRNIGLKDILLKLLNKPGGIELVTKVNDIPKGSRLAVSTTLLATVIARLMRFSGQIKNQTGTLSEDDRRVVASRAILGEWLGGSGGGWQDSGGLWPGMKVITGKLAAEGDPEYCVSRGCLLPEYNIFSRDEIPDNVEKLIMDSIVLVHGGISQDVGPILEMVTEKYLLRYEKEWNARKQGSLLFDKILNALRTGNMKELGRLTTQDWEKSIQQSIPWVNNAFTERLIDNVKKEFKVNYWGFLMLGGMSGGGMAFIVNPEIRDLFKQRVAEIMFELKQLYKNSFPFIIDPVVYDFDFNHDGIVADLLTAKDALIPEVPFTTDNYSDISSDDDREMEIKRRYGFDIKSHENMKLLLEKGEIGLAKNRLPLSTIIENVSDGEIMHFIDDESNSEFYKTGMNAISDNEVAVITFSGGTGSRWTHGSAVAKAINPFLKVEGKYRTFLEQHIAKSRKTGKLFGAKIQHVFTTSYLTHDAIEHFLKVFDYFDYEGHIYLSQAKSIGNRVYPMERDLRFLWEEQIQQKLDENSQKLLDNIHNALIDWVKSRGEGRDYSENKYIYRFNPPGHWYEIPNLIKNGCLASMLKDNPNLKYLFCHNIDTMGAYIEPVLLGMHVNRRSCLTFEVTPRRIEDQGGGLAKVNGSIQLIEGLAIPVEEDEYKLSYYNTLTNWVSLDPLLEFFGLDRKIVIEAVNVQKYRNKIIEAIRKVEKEIPTYVTIKDVKYTWGKGQEDIYPVAQFEKLWGDMSRFKELESNYVSVKRYRGQQLKAPSQLYMWMIDGSLDYLKNTVCF